VHQNQIGVVASRCGERLTGSLGQDVNSYPGLNCSGRYPRPLLIRGLTPAARFGVFPQPSPAPLQNSSDFR
jgi:hypothetical protein